MERIIQVLFCSMLVCSAYSQQGQSHNDQHVQEIEDRQRISDLINLSKLLQTAARLAYPVTTGINKIVGSIMENENLLVPNRYRQESYERYPSRSPNRRGNLNRNTGRNSVRPNVQNQRTASGRNTNRRRAYTPTYYDYDYEYEEDDDSLEAYDSYQASDEFYFQKPAIQSKPKGSKVKGTVLLSDTHHNKHVKAFPASKDPQPKIIYVVVKPDNVNLGNNKSNDEAVSNLSDQDDDVKIDPRSAFNFNVNKPELVNSTSGTLHTG